MDLFCSHHSWSMFIAYQRGLAWETPTDEVRKYFEQSGDYLEAVVITDKNTGSKSMGYGFVIFRDTEAAKRACDDPNPVIDERRANCNIASLRPPRPSSPQGRNQGGTAFHQGSNTMGQGASSSYSSSSAAAATTTFCNLYIHLKGCYPIVMSDSNFTWSLFVAFSPNKCLLLGHCQGSPLPRAKPVETIEREERVAQPLAIPGVGPLVK